VDFLSWWAIITNIIDIFIIAIIVYFLLQIISGTRAVQLIKGLILIFVAALISQLLNLNTVNWFLNSTLTMVIVALPIVFQPELRRALEHIGRGRFIREYRWRDWGPKDINNIVFSINHLSEEKVGALIVIARNVGLKNFIESGTMLEALISTELIENIFIKNSPLHDGAVIIENSTIKAAACFLPLSSNPAINPKLGTRHRAALGMSEESDAIALVVSEESGVISMAKEGELLRYLDVNSLREQLFKELHVQKRSFFK